MADAMDKGLGPSGWRAGLLADSVARRHHPFCAGDLVTNPACHVRRERLGHVVPVVHPADLHNAADGVLPLVARHRHELPRFPVAGPCGRDGVRPAARAAAARCFGRGGGGASGNPPPASRSRCRYISRPNIHPHSVTGFFIHGRAASTFSITHGRPVAFSASRTGVINSG